VGARVRLLLRPARLGDESAPGYVLRLAQANGLRRASWLREDMIPGQVGRGRVLPLSVARACPVCLSERQVWRASWTLPAVPVCVAHGRALIDTCPRCKAPLRWRNLQLTECRCGFDLSQAGGVSLRAASQRFVEALSRGDSPLAQLSLQDLAAVVSVIGVGVHSAAKRRGRRSFTPTSLAQCLVAFEKAAGILGDWPGQFERHLARSLPAAKARRPVSPSQCYAGLYRAFGRELAGPQFQFLRDAVRDFLERRWPLPLNRRNGAIDAARAEALPFSAASEHLGVSKKTLLALARTADISLSARQTRSGRRFRSVRRRDLRLLERAQSDLISHRAAAVELGVSRPRVKELVDAGLLKAHVHRRVLRVRRSGIEQLCERLLAIATTGVPSADHLPVPELLRSRLPAGCFGALIADVMRGKVPLHQATSLNRAVFAGLSIAKGLLATYRTGASSTTLLTGPQIATALKIKQEVVYALVRNGMIRSTAQRVGARRRALVSSNDLERFLALYVSGVELADCLRSRSRTVTARLATFGVVPASGPGVDDCRQHFFRRDARLERAMGAIAASIRP
jgi:hypothetical protein